MAELLTNKVRVQSLVDVVAERLEAAIISGELAPGAKLSEQGLANSLGVSRGPLREAIRRLEGRKLIERTPNIGVRVAQLSGNDLEELLFVREALEGMACRLAAELMPDAEIEALGELLTKHRKQVATQGVSQGYYQEAKDFDFHFRIIKASKNDKLVSMLCGDLYDLLRVYRYKSSTQEGRAEKALEEHQAIIDALASRDPDRAEATMRTHIRNARASARERAGKADAQPAPKSPPKATALRSRGG